MQPRPNSGRLAGKHQRSHDTPDDPYIAGKGSTQSPDPIRLAAFGISFFALAPSLHPLNTPGLEI